MSEFPRDEYMTTGQAAAILGVSAETVRRWVTAGKLDAVTTTGGHHLVHRDAVRSALPRPTNETES